jgi:predicted O-methyltransferase YrrM
VYSFIREVLNDDRYFYAYGNIERLRLKMLQGSSETMTEDLALQQKKFGQLLFRMVDYYAPASIIELGTSSGFTTLYLASANAGTPIVTTDTEISEQALQRFTDLQLNHIKTIKGEKISALSTAITQLGRADLVFIGDNQEPDEMLQHFHQLLPALHSGSMLIFNGIHRSREIEQAWKQIQTHASVTLTVDLFFIGIVLFRKENKAQQHFTIRF